MLKVLNGTITANNDPLFLRVMYSSNLKKYMKGQLHFIRNIKFYEQCINNLFVLKNIKYQITLNEQFRPDNYEWALLEERS